LDRDRFSHESILLWIRLLPLATLLIVEGRKRIEFEKGKSAIAAALIDTLNWMSN
jgi:hypothetical protein